MPMSEKAERVIWSFALALLFYPMLIGAMYLWLRAIRSPLRGYQRRMLAFNAIWFAAMPLLCPSCLAAAFWLGSIQTSGTIAIILFLIWGGVTFRIVRSMSMHGHFVDQPEAY